MEVVAASQGTWTIADETNGIENCFADATAPTKFEFICESKVSYNSTPLFKNYQNLSNLLIKFVFGS